MDNRDILREIALRADDKVLALLSYIPSLWSLIRSELEKNYFWYLRTDEAFNLPDELAWEKTSEANWHQIYNILISTREGNPFAASTQRHAREINLTTLELNDYNPIAVKLLLKWGYDPSVDRSYSLLAASAYATSEILQLLIDDERIHPEDRNYWFEWAAGNGRVDNTKVLLQNKKTREVIDEDEVSILTDSFGAAVRNNHLEAAEFVLDEIARRDIAIYEHGDDHNEMIVDAIRDSSPEMIKLLLDESLLDVRDSDWIETSVDADRPEIFMLLVGQESPFEYLEMSRRKNPGGKIVKYIEDRARSPIRSASQLSGLAEAEIEEMLIQVSKEGNYNRYHFEMLLSEIVIKQADIGYYLDWIITRTKHWHIEDHVIDLVGRAAASVIDGKKVVHYTDDFTAYSGFFLLANSPDRDVEAVLNTLRSEEGVTNEGLRRASLLLGAFDGRLRT